MSTSSYDGILQQEKLVSSFFILLSSIDRSLEIKTRTALVITMLYEKKRRRADKRD
jgi:hypothetical protein